MKHRFIYGVAVLFCLLAFPSRSPAPLIYTPDEGWIYEKPGADTKWQRTRAKDQLQVAQEAFDKKNYTLAKRAANRVVTKWGFSDHAPQAQYLVGRCYEAQGKDEVAFKHYQQLLAKYPKMTNAQEVLEREFIIANKFLAGQWRKLFGYIPLPPSNDKTVEMYKKVIKNAPYSDVAPQAQMNIGAVREKQNEFAKAAQAYEGAADKYSDKDKVVSDALYKAGLASLKESRTAEYDQSAASKAINTFSVFSALYPNDQRVAESQKKILELKAEQARGAYQTARYYEKKKKWSAAMIYYNEVRNTDPDPNSKYAADALKRLVEIKKRIEKN